MKGYLTFIAAFIFLAIPMDATAQLKCILKPRDCVKKEVEEQNKILSRLWIKQQLIRATTQQLTGEVQQCIFIGVYRDI